MKSLEFRGSALGDLRAFPTSSRRECGFQIDRLQRGLEPADCKPLSSVGSGVSEIRVSDSDAAFRVVDVAKIESAIYVLHCFRKKTQKTAGTDIELAKARYKSLLRELKKWVSVDSRAFGTPSKLHKVRPRA